jgi:putative heme-binding domain-containing protein
MAAGTGEAPSGIVAYESDQIVALRGALLATSWGDHRIDAFTPGGDHRANTVTRPMVRRALVTGDEDFRPVGLVVAPDGSLYASDWVDRSYNLHGKGRVWRIRAKERPVRVAPRDDVEALRHSDRAIREDAARRLARVADPVSRAALRARVTEDPDPRVVASALDAMITTALPDDDETFRKALAHPIPEIRGLATRRLPEAMVVVDHVAAVDSSAMVRAEALRRIHHAGALPAILTALADPDPFLRQAAREGLRRSVSREQLFRLLRHPMPAVRLGAVLVLRDLGDPDARVGINIAFSDRDSDVRFAVLQWIAEAPQDNHDLSHRLDLNDPRLNAREFVATLAVLERLGRSAPGQPVKEFSAEDHAARLLDVEPVEMSGPLLARVLRILRPDHPSLNDERLARLVNVPNPALQIEALRSWRARPGFDRFDMLARFAQDVDLPRPVRLEAIIGLAGADLSNPDRRAALVELAGTKDLLIRRESLRALRGAPLTISESARLEKTAARGDPISVDLLDAVGGFDTTTPEPPRPLAEWIELLKGPNDPESGGRIYFHPKGPGCFRCHQIDGRGGRSGPDLTRVGTAISPEKLLESILEPGKEVAPQFVTWSLALRDGRVVTGTRLGETPEGIEYGDANGRTVVVKPDEVEEALPQRESLMPNGLHRLLTEQELRDLIAFLLEPRG